MQPVAPVLFPPKGRLSAAVPIRWLALAHFGISAKTHKTAPADLQISELSVAGGMKLGGVFFPEQQAVADSARLSLVVSKILVVKFQGYETLKRFRSTYDNSYHKGRLRKLFDPSISNFPSLPWPPSSCNPHVPAVKKSHGWQEESQEARGQPSARVCYYFHRF